MKRKIKSGVRKRVLACASNALREKSFREDKQTITSAKVTEKTPALKIVILEDK